MEIIRSYQFTTPLGLTFKIHIVSIKGDFIVMSDTELKYREEGALSYA